MEIRGAAQRRSVLTTAELRGWVARLSDLDAGVGDAERVDQLRLLEELKGAAAAAQARVTVAFAESQVEADPAQEGRGVAAQVALARRDSPHRGARHVGLATGAGRRDAAHPGRVVPRPDQRVAGHPDGPRDRRAVASRTGAGSMSGSRVGSSTSATRGVEREARALAYELDPGSILRRGRRAIADRRVTSAAGTGHDDAADRVPAGRPGSRGLRRADPRRRPAQTTRRPPQPGSADGRPDGRPTHRPATGHRGAGGGSGGDVRPGAARATRPQQAAAHLVGWRADPGRSGPGPGRRGRPGLGAPALRVTGRRDAGGHGQPPPEASTGSCASSWSPATRPAAPRGATPRSGTPTTSPQPPTTAPPARPTARDSARPATTPKPSPAGPPGRSAPDPGTR